LVFWSRRGEGARASFTAGQMASLIHVVKSGRDLHIRYVGLMFNTYDIRSVKIRATDTMSRIRALCTVAEQSYVVDLKTT